VLLLAFDTATPAVTAALHDGTAVLAESTTIDARRHGELLLPVIDRVLHDAGAAKGDLTAVVVGVGPGPYTGLRVGLVTAQVFGAAHGIPVHGLCTLDGIAYAAGLDPPFVVAPDARRKEVYWARYADARTRLGEPAVDRPAELPADVADLPAVGAGAQLYETAFGQVRTDLPAHQSAAALAALAAERLAAAPGPPGSASSGAVGLLPPRPLYLRRPDAQVPANYKVVTPR